MHTVYAVTSPGTYIQCTYATIVESGFPLIKCECCGKWAPDRRAGRTPVLALYGYPVSGFVWSDSAEIFVSGHLLGYLNDNRLTGFTFAPTEISEVSIDGNEVSRPDERVDESLYWLNIHGRGGRLRNKTRNIEVAEFCDACGSGDFVLPPPSEFILDAAEWDGCDFFLSDESGYCFISARAREVLEGVPGERNYSLVPAIVT